MNSQQCQSPSCLPWADKAAAWTLYTTLSALFSPGRGAQPGKLGLLTSYCLDLAAGRDAVGSFPALAEVSALQFVTVR